MPLCPKCGTELPEEAMFCPKDGEAIPVLAGKVLDERYRVNELIATGGVGSVYRGTHLALDRPVAIKVLRGTFATLPEFVERFQREARALSAIRHVNVVSVSDFGVADGVPFFVMELLDGRSLSSEIKRLGRIPVDRAVAIARQVLAALAFAHKQGVIHRDLKPSNVMLLAQKGVGELVKILDFGLAKFTETSTSGARGEPLTRAGIVFGTPAYMAPEQAMGQPVDARSDIYAAGVMLYEMLVGSRPFGDATGADLTRRRLLEDPKPPSVAAPEASISEAVDAVVLRALRKTPEERFGSADELGAALLAAAPDAGGASEESSGLLGLESALTRPDVHLGVEATIPADRPQPPPDSETASAPEDPSDHPTAVERPASSGAPPAALEEAETLRAPSPLSDASGEAPVDADEAERATGRGRRPLLVVLAALAGALLLAGGVGLAIRSWPTATGPIDAATDSADGTAQPADAPDAEADALPPLPPSRDPFAEPLPEELEWLKARAGRKLRRREDRERREEIKERYRDDARLYLILGHGLARKIYFTAAMERYERALKLDPAVRGDPLLRENLLRALGAKRASVSERALEVVRSAYGPEAVDLLLWGAYSHPDQSAGDGAVSALDALDARARLDPVLHGLADVRRQKRCPERRDALDRLRGRKDPRIAPALRKLRDESPQAVDCLGELLDTVIETSSP